MPLMAKAAAMSGAVGIRANTVRDITQIKQVVDLPVIGIIKKDYPGTPMYITVTMKEVTSWWPAGWIFWRCRAPAPCGRTERPAAEFIREVKQKYPDQLLMADIATDEEAMACAAAGADFVGTTMRAIPPRPRASTKPILTSSHGWQKTAPPG